MEGTFSTGMNRGSVESQRLYFEAIGKGETELVLVYRRSSEEDGAYQWTFQVDVTVK